MVYLLVQCDYEGLSIIDVYDNLTSALKAMLHVKKQDAYTRLEAQRLMGSDLSNDFYRGEPPMGTFRVITMPVKTSFNYKNYNNANI